jgi:hypothetical protein
MLGRMRMSIQHTVNEYRELCKNIYGTKRFHSWNTYNHRVLEREILSMVERNRSEEIRDGETKSSLLLTNPTKMRDLCRT